MPDIFDLQTPYYPVFEVPGGFLSYRTDLLTAVSEVNDSVSAGNVLVTSIRDYFHDTYGPNALAKLEQIRLASVGTTGSVDALTTIVATMDARVAAILTAVNSIVTLIGTTNTTLATVNTSITSSSTVAHNDAVAIINSLIALGITAHTDAVTAHNDALTLATHTDASTIITAIGSLETVTNVIRNKLNTFQINGGGQLRISAL